MMVPPKVSVIVPFFNEEKYIEKCMRSVLGQTLTDFELVMVDDGSTDGSTAIVQDLSRADRRVRLVNLKRSGLVCALNAGIEASSGEYIARMDADDIMHRERLSLQYDFMRSNPQVNVLGSLVQTFPKKIISPNMHHYVRWQNSLTDNDTIRRDMFIESPLAHPSVMLRRSELKALGGYLDTGMPEDYDLWLRYHAAGGMFHKIPRILHFWRDRPERHSRTSQVYSQDNFVRLKARYLAETVLKEKKRVYIWGAGRDGRNLFRHLAGRGLDIIGFIDIDPKKISRNICGLPVIGYNRITGTEIFVVVCVGTKGARGLIRTRLDECGYRETIDYVCAA